jgi:hypothetical protein
MTYPKFERENLNPNLAKGEIGDAFQNFVYELLLPDYHHLHMFPTAGKDGGIDLSQTTATSRIVFECKYVGDGELRTAISRWRTVADNLKRNISVPTGPIESQYSPWYKTDPQIKEYHFCVSTELRNQGQFDDLPTKITDFFKQLGADYPHLSHLADISVKIHDWSDLCRLLSRHPRLLFRWFPRTRPQGLVLLDESPDLSAFRSYLSSSTLRYYSRSQHLKVAPTDIEIPDEDALLNCLEDGPVTGLVITGGGGVGKTRLSLELGWLAQEKGWVVLRATSKLKENALASLAEQLDSDSKVLILADYIETQRDFSALVDSLNDLNDTYYLRLRYVANCRTSYYQTIAGTSRQRQVDLSPIGKSQGEEWFALYQQSTVRHILEQSGITVRRNHLEVCRNLPVLAVFMSYLQRSGRELDLEELLSEADFAKWVAKRMELSFHTAEVSRELALLMALLPSPDNVFDHPDLKKQKTLLGILSTDRWIEKISSHDSGEGERWEAAHDVLADQLVLSHLNEFRYIVDHFIRDLLQLARDVGRIRPTLIALQRLVDQPVVASTNWFRILDTEIAKDLNAWRDVRDILIRTSLLKPAERIHLLSKYESIWEDEEKDTGFQNSLGWLARWAINTEKSNLEPSEKAVLARWVKKAAGYVNTSNILLTYGLRFLPEAVKDDALNWIRTRPTLFQTHYLLVAWLEKELPLEDVALEVKQWIQRFKLSSNFSFLLRAWLNAGGGKELMQEPMLEWLKRYGAEPEASYIYSRWLDAGGGNQLVQESMVGWLEQHGAEPEAGFIYRSWLNAGGGKELVQGPMLEWLERYGADSETRYVYSSWLDAGGDKELVQEPMLEWLEQHGVKPEAGFIYNSWLNAGGGKELVQEPMVGWLKQHGAEPESGFIYRGWLDAGGDKELVREPMLEWLKQHGAEPEAGYIYSRWLNAGGDKEFVCELMLNWLSQSVHSSAARFVYRNWLKAGGKKEIINDLMVHWLNANSNSQDAGLVSSAWLEVRGDPDVLTDHLREWLRVFGSIEEARFVYKGWLDAGGSKELIRDGISAWLNEHGIELNATYIYQPWLIVGGDKELIEPHLKNWLTLHGTKPQALFLYRVWLRAIGDKETVRASITAYLTEQRRNKGLLVQILELWIKFGGDNELINQVISDLSTKVEGLIDLYLVFQAWLKAGGDREAIKAAMLFWLQKYGAAKEAAGVYKHWLRTGGELVVISDSLLAWINEHGMSEEALPVYINWLNSGGDKLLIQNSLLACLQSHSNANMVINVYQCWIKRGGDIEGIRALATEWLRQNWQTRQSLMLIKLLIDQTTSDIEMLRAILEFCRDQPSEPNSLAALILLESHLSQLPANEVLLTTKAVLNISIYQINSLPEGAKISITKVIIYLVIAATQWPIEYYEQLDDIILMWLRNPASFGSELKLDGGFHKVEFVERVLSLIQSDKLSQSIDRESITRFIEWVVTWDQDRLAELPQVFNLMRI